MWWLVIIFAGTVGAVLGLAEFSKRRAMQQRATRLSGGAATIAMGGPPSAKSARSKPLWLPKPVT